MSTKAFGIYTSGGNSITSGDELVLEIGYDHMACMVKRVTKNAIANFELFTFGKEETSDFGELFSNVLVGSKLLDKSFASTHIYINNELALPVPVFKFNKEIATDYLNVVFGEDGGAKKQFDHLDTQPDLMNVYRLPQEWFNILNHHLMMVDVHHTFSTVIRRVLENATEGSPVIYVQFYYLNIIVAVMKGKDLQFIQSFTYQSPEDVLYYLLNISQRFSVNTSDLAMKVSGIIDTGSGLYSELVKYFKNVSVENVDANHLLIDIHNHPSHYFTPFFNLAV
jgi:hypothetical protein